MSFTVLTRRLEGVEDEVLAAYVDVHAVKNMYIAMRDNADGEEKAKYRRITVKLDRAEALLEKAKSALESIDDR